MSGNDGKPQKYCKGCEFCTCETKKPEGKKKVYRVGCTMDVTFNDEQQTVTIWDTDNINGTLYYALQTQDGKDLGTYSEDDFQEMLPE